MLSIKAIFMAGYSRIILNKKTIIWKHYSSFYRERLFNLNKIGIYAMALSMGIFGALYGGFVFVYDRPEMRNKIEEYLPKSKALFEYVYTDLKMGELLDEQKARLLKAKSLAEEARKEMEKEQMEKRERAARESATLSRWERAKLWYKRKSCPILEDLDE